MAISTSSLWKYCSVFMLCFCGMISKSFAIHDYINSFRKAHPMESGVRATQVLPEEIRSPFKFIGGLMFVTVQINGVTGLLLVDTGSNGFILLNSDHFKTEKTNQRLKGMTSEVAIERVEVNSLTWQNLQLEKQYLPAVKLSQLNQGSSEKVLGLLGSAFFKSYQLNLNFASREMVLSKQGILDPKLKGIPATISMPFTLLNNFPVVEVKIADQPYRFIMDTGATDNVMDLSLESRIGKEWQQTQEVKMVEGSGIGATVRRGKLQSLWVGGLNMQGIGMGLHAMPDFDQKMGVSGILGFQFLKYFYVQINYLENTMKFYDMATVLK
ncbi:pepsin/retropepsin-like aspartic protease family protein [Pedobacter gandavensis]|uniref:pepsin/retropepsin-like aspartic protease family protein n=1 Tax=Pedobacter gandavensis TaxID=2679963 RepID=UPI00292E359D|nr:pepsin/retropepsin-like aspartic protease family protein [Pedobacter gandavensis]